MKLGEYLIKGKHVTQARLDEALEIQAGNSPHKLLGEVLVEMGAIETHVLFQQLMAFTREKNADTATLKEWISQEEIDRLMAEGAGSE